MHLSRRVRKPSKKLNAYSRDEALRAVEVAFTELALGAPSGEQCGDLADAIDSLGDGDFGLAVALARAAVRPRRSVEKGRPPDKVPSMDEMHRDFEKLQQAD